MIQNVVARLMSYYDHRANYALKWLWICLNKGCRNLVFILVAEYYSQAIGNPRNGIGISGTRHDQQIIQMLYKITYSSIYTQQNTVPGTYKK